MKTVLQSVLIIFIFVGYMQAAEERELWLTDFDEAQALAKKSDKDIFLLFTGSDWCPPCQMLHSQILSKEEFEKNVRDDFVLVKADFPRNNEQSAELKARNRQLQNQFAEYGFSGYPTVFLCEESGEPYHMEVGPWGDSVQAYLDFLTGKKEFITGIHTLLKEMETNPKETAEKLDQLFETVDFEVVMNNYKDEMQLIIDAVDQTHPLHVKYSRYLQFNDTVEKALQFYTQEEHTLREKETYLEKQLADANITKPERQLMHFLYAVTYHEEKQIDKAVEHLKKAIAAYPHSRKAVEFQGFLETMLAQQQSN